MLGPRLRPSWFARDATEVAPELLGAVLRLGGHDALVTEVEAYTADDPASHSWNGATARNASMFGPSGRWYVYLVYGMHHCLNVVTGATGDGQAVLIRSVAVHGIDPRRTTGPGRLCRTLGIDRAVDGTTAVVHRGPGTWAPVVVTERVGITRATDWPRRWLIAG